MKAQHTPGPWQVGVGGVYPKGQPELETMSVSIYGTKPQEGFSTAIVASIAPFKDMTLEDEANAYRITECVNACEGIENPADLRKQRDELLAALLPFANLIKSPLDEVGGGTFIAPSVTVQMIKDAQTAIDNAKPQ